MIKLKYTINNLEQDYENSLMLVDSPTQTDEETVHNIVRKSCETLKCAQEEFHSYNTAFHGIINEHPLLASYSNIFVILYASLKELSRLTGEITYSWKIYLKLIDMIIAKIIRDLTMNLKSNNDDSMCSDEGDGLSPGHRKSKKNKEREFTIDEEFFHSVIMPSIYSTIVAGIK